MPNNLPTSREISLLGLCGSLRAGSSNLRALQAAQALVPANTTLAIYTDIGALPAFNPDTDPLEHPTVARFTSHVRDCDALLVSSPVYARGYPGALKNALDWLVGTDAFVAKPFALLNASNRSLEIQDTLITVITTMSGVHITTATTALPLLGQQLQTTEILADAALAGQIGQSVEALVTHCRTL